MKIVQIKNLDDLVQLVPLFNAYRMFYHQPENRELCSQFLGDRIEKQDSILFGAYDEEEKMQGFVQIYPVFSSISCKKDYILNDLYVAVEARRRGAAKALLKRAQEYVREEGGKGLALETAGDNPAQKLYRELGWEVDKEFLHYYWCTENKILR